MESREFSIIRHHLGKNQKQLAHLLCISTKAVQSYEEGWRDIPPNAERQLLFLLGLKRSSDKTVKPCWEILGCPTQWRDKCAAWEFNAGYFCWFINGTYCQGEVQDEWKKKRELCWKCEVFRLMIPALV